MIRGAAGIIQMDENVYHFYHKMMDFGFCVRRATWGKDTFARDVYIEGVIPSEPIAGEPPYYYNPPVYAILYIPNKKPEAIMPTTPGGYNYQLTKCKQFQPKVIKSGFTYRDVKYSPEES